MALLRTYLAALQVVLLLLLFPAPVSAAACTKPSIRKEWRALSKSERTDWIRAINCVATLPHSDALKPSVNPGGLAPINTSGSYYDDLVYMHMDMDTLVQWFPMERFRAGCLNNVERYVTMGGHSPGIVGFYTRLKMHSRRSVGFKEPIHTGTGGKVSRTICASDENNEYRTDASDFYGSPFFKDSDSESGLGGWGDPNNDFEVQDGGFSVHSSFRLSYPSPHPLRRNFTLQPYLNVGPPNAQFIQDPTLDANASLTYSAIDSMINGFVGDYKGLQAAVEGWQGPYVYGHLILGGDLAGHCPATAPASCATSPGPTINDPLFWLHHGMIDKIWADWQSKDKQNANAFYAGSVQAFENATYYNEWPTGAPPLLQLNDTMPNEGMFPANTIGDVLSTTGDVLCYKYE